MAVFTIQSPDGRKIKIEAADEATAVRGAQEWAQANPSNVKKLTGTVGKMDPAQAGVSDNVQGLNAQDAYGFSLKQIRERYYPNLTDEQWQKSVEAGITNLKPVDAGGLLNDGMTMGLSDEARGLAGATGALFAGQNPQQAFSDFQNFEQKRRAAGAETAGPLGIVAQIGGAVLAGRPDQAAASVASKLPAWVKGGMDAAKQGAVYGFASTEGDIKDRAAGAATGAAFGGVTGAAVPVVAGKVADMVTGNAQRAATNAAIKGAPAASDLKSLASGMFQQLDQSGVEVAPSKLGQMATDLIQKFVKMRANPNLDPKAVGALQEVVKAINDAQVAGKGLALSDLHTLRQIAQKSAQSAEGRDKMFSTQIINAIDDMISGLKPADIVGGASPDQASKLMFDAISTWGRSRRVGLIEEAIYRAQNVASGTENGLRIEFRKLLQNPDTRKLFSDAERQAIEDVVRGNSVSNVTKLLGKFGFGTNGAGNMLGGTIGFGAGSVFGGPVGGMLAAGAGTAARKVSEKMTEGAAQRAAQVVATPNIPNVSRMDPAALQRAMQSLLRGAQPLISQ